ncbi:MAG TPA: SIS domain-containing protein [Anaerolineales bacterium]|nr:SIS domain-containing protein [Anaerolineales bacterium]
MNPMIAQIKSVPDLVRQVVPAYTENIACTHSQEFCQSFDHLYLMGCGDSHHVSVATQLAFRVLAGIETEALTAMHFARYTADSLHHPQRCLVAGVSVSGEVSRTLESMLLARKAGAKVLALTATSTSRIARAADVVVDTTQPPFQDPEGMVIPGVRSYVANQIGLLLLAIHFGEQRRRISHQESEGYRQQIYNLAEAIETTIEMNDSRVKDLAGQWADETEFIFCGSGPGFAAALFSAAKILEATGDAAIGQDLEEWAHLQYFAKKVSTPTFVISGGERDESRALEVVIAAMTIGRRVAIITPAGKTGFFPESAVKFPFVNGVPEMFQALLTMLPGSLFAAHRAELLSEPYFRDFSGGRSKEGGGGISRIRTSETLGLEYLKEDLHDT